MDNQIRERLYVCGKSAKEVTLANQCAMCWSIVYRLTAVHDKNRNIMLHEMVGDDTAQLNDRMTLTVLKQAPPESSKRPPLHHTCQCMSISQPTITIANRLRFSSSTSGGSKVSFTTQSRKHHPAVCILMWSCPPFRTSRVGDGPRRPLRSATPHVQSWRRTPSPTPLGNSARPELAMS